MFEQENGWENAYLVSVYNLFTTLCQFQFQVKSTDTFITCFFGESLKLESVWDHYVNMKFNVFIQRLQTFFILVTFFYVFNVFLILISTFFTSMVL